VKELVTQVEVPPEGRLVSVDEHVVAVVQVTCCAGDAFGGVHEQDEHPQLLFHCFAEFSGR